MVQQLAALLAALSLGAGASVPLSGNAATFAALLEETNAAHAKIDAPRADLDRYRYDFQSGKPLFTLEDGKRIRAFDQNNLDLHDPLPADEARAEVGWVMRLLRSQYGLYTWSGGDAAFDKAEKEILAALPETGTIALADYKALMIRHLSFIGDTHFSFDGHNFQPDIQLFADESRAYYRKNGAFYTDAACTDAVRAIDGQAPETYLKRAIGQNGELTYYLYRLAPRAEALEMKVETARGTFTAKLHLAVSLDSRTAPEENYVYSVRGGIPFMELNRTVFGEDDQSGWSNQHDEDDKQAFLASAEAIKEYPAAVLDLSHNPGGNGDLPPEWFYRYTGEQAQPNYCTLRIRASDTWLRSCYGAENEEQCAEIRAQTDAYHAAGGLRVDGDYYVGAPEPQFLEQPDRVLFVLTARHTASAAEAFTDLMHNLKNVVTIGANTGGVLTNGANYGISLPYSGLFFQFGECLFYWDPAYFQEGAGMTPDVYLTGDRLNERLELFLTRYAGMQSKK